MAENGRLYDAEKVIEDFLEIMSAHRGEVNVTITTAQPLERDLLARLESSLKQSTLAGQGKTLIIQNKVNEAVLGGLIVDFGDKTIDLSVASRVNKLNASLQGSFSTFLRCNFTDLHFSFLPLLILLALVDSILQSQFKLYRNCGIEKLLETETVAAAFAEALCEYSAVFNLNLHFLASKKFEVTEIIFCLSHLFIKCHWQLWLVVQNVDRPIHSRKCPKRLAVIEVYNKYV